MSWFRWCVKFLPRLIFRFLKIILRNCVLRTLWWEGLCRRSHRSPVGQLDSGARRKSFAFLEPWFDSTHLQNLLPVFGRAVELPDDVCLSHRHHVWCLSTLFLSVSSSLSSLSLSHLPLSSSQSVERSSSFVCLSRQLWFLYRKLFLENNSPSTKHVCTQKYCSPICSYSIGSRIRFAVSWFT